MSAEDNYQAIKNALRQGLPELADAIDADRRCKDCGAYVSDDGMCVDTERCCFFCSPG